MRDTSRAVRAKSRAYERAEEEQLTQSWGGVTVKGTGGNIAGIQAQVGFKQVRGEGCEGSGERHKSLEGHLEIQKEPLVTEVQRAGYGGHRGEVSLKS